MRNLMRKWFGKSRNQRQSARPQRTTRLQIEQLEDRFVPSVTFHGGPVIQHVQATNVFYGADWALQSNQQDVQDLNTFLRTITGSSYLAMLGEYNVGRGSFVGGDVQPSGPAANTTVTESSIQNMLVGEILSGRVVPPTGSTVYIVHLPPNVHSQFDDSHSFMGHHSNFVSPVLTWGWVGGLYMPQITYRNVYYAVIPHPQGNLADNGYNLTTLTTDFQKQTEIVSHELAETVTNPIDWRDSSGAWHGGWWDSKTGDEIGDIVNQQVAFLDGYAVQREWSNYWQRGIVPLFDTFGTYLGYPGQFWASTSTPEGRHGYLAFGGYTPFLQLAWQLDDASWSGWYVVG